MTITTPPKKNKADVLLVEDNAADVYVTRLAFAKGRVAVSLHVATDGDDAMHFLRKQGKWLGAPRPDLVILDLNMPRRNGREVLAEMRADPLLRRIPVVVLTSSSADADIFDVYDLGANACFTKPSDFDSLTQIVLTLEDLWFVLGQLPSR